MKRTFSKPKKRAPGRKPRADAQRNRIRILEVAKDAFTRAGATASLDEIARQAKVGPGTLYRHFPTRDALIEAVYRSEVEKLAAAAQQYAESMPPVEAMRAWMLLLVDFIAAKQIIAPALETVVGGPKKLYESSRSLLRNAGESLLQRAKDSGEIRSDVDPLDLPNAIIGLSHMAKGPDWQPSARRLVDILIAGVRTVQ
jgi:AcrR family transcriptional regulator